MGVRILLDGPGSAAGRRLGRAVAVTAALPLILLGVVGAIGLAFVGVLLATGSVDHADEPKAYLLVGGCAVATVGGLWGGLRLLRGRRRIVLFLRRFGYADATNIVSFAATTVLGGSWRLVTLDDDLVRGVGARPAARRASGLGILLVFAAVAGFAWWFVQFGADSTFDAVLSGMDSSSSGSEALDGIGRAFAAAAVTGLLIFVLAILLLVVTGVSVPMLLFSYVRARRADRASTDRIRSDGELGARVSAIARYGRRIFAPRLVVVTVAHPIWQRAVHSFAHSAAAVIIDVSIPSDSLRWEINALLPVLGRRCVLVGRLDTLTRQLPNGRTVLDTPLARDIDGHDILAYRTDHRGQRRFAHALRHTIDARVTG